MSFKLHINETLLTSRHFSLWKGDPSSGLCLPRWVPCLLGYRNLYLNQSLPPQQICFLLSMAAQTQEEAKKCCHSQQPPEMKKADSTLHPRALAHAEAKRNSCLRSVQHPMPSAMSLLTFCRAAAQRQTNSPLRGRQWPMMWAHTLLGCLFLGSSPEKRRGMGRKLHHLNSSLL